MSREYDLPNMGGATISVRLTARLIQELRAGEYAVADRLPPELELAEKYGVSRSVIRDALSNLEGAGLIERGRGIGTVIHREIVNLNNRLDVKFEYNELVRGAGATPGTDSVRLSVRPADETLASRLEIDLGESIVVCEKRILANDRPVIWSVDYLPERLFAGRDFRALNWGRPIFDLLEELFGIAVDTSVANLSALAAPPQVAKALQLQKGEPVILLEETSYYKLTRPILQSCGFYSTFFDFTILRRKF